MHVIVIDCHVRIVVYFNIGDLVVVQVIFLSFLADDVKSNIIFLFYHNLHLIQNEFKLLSSVHGSIGFYLNFLQDFSCLQNIIIVLFALYNH